MQVVGGIKIHLPKVQFIILSIGQTHYDFAHKCNGQSHTNFTHVLKSVKEECDEFALASMIGRIAGRK